MKNNGVGDTGMGEEINRKYANLSKAKEMMEILGIPHSDDYWSTVCVVALYDILMDEEKLRVLVSKLKLKAFW